MFPLTQLAIAAYALWASHRFGFDVYFNAVLAVCTLACAAFDPFLFLGLLKIEQTEAARRYVQLLQEQVAWQEGHLADLTEGLVTADALRQDMKRQLEGVRESLRTGGARNVGQSLAAVSSSMHARKGRICAHPVADALLCAKGAVCEKSGIEMGVHADIPTDTCLLDSELCAVLANLMDNAIAACAGMGKPGARIDVDATRAGCPCNCSGQPLRRAQAYAPSRSGA